MLSKTLDGVLNLLGVLLWVAVCARLGLWMLAPNYWYGHPTVARRTFDYRKNPAAALEYGRRMRSFFAFQITGMCAQNAELLKKFEAGDYQGDRQAFDSDTSTLANALLDTIQQFEGQEVPDILAQAHAKIAASHRYCYESTQFLREAYDAEGAERTRLVKEAEKKLAQARSSGFSGLREYNRTWARLPWGAR